MFKEALQDLVEGTEGGLAGLLMDSSGIALESYAKDDSPFDINTIGIEFSVVIGSIKRASEMLEAGRGQRDRGRDRPARHHHPDPRGHVFPRPGDEAGRQLRKRPLLDAYRRPEADGGARLKQEATPRAARGSSCLSGPNLQLLGHAGARDLRQRDARGHPRAPRGPGRASSARRSRRFQSNHEGELLDRIGAARGALRRDPPQRAARSRTRRSRSSTRSRRSACPASRSTSRTPRPARPTGTSRSSRRRASRKVSGFGGDSYLLALEGLVRWLAPRVG